MKVKNWIRKNPVVISRSALLPAAVLLMKEHNIRHLPVVDGGQLVGFITESDLRQFSFPAMVEDIPVHQVMVSNPITIDAEASVEDAAKIIFENKIGGLPVLEDGELLGVITASDLLAAFIEVMGLLKATTRLDVQVDEKCGNVDMVTGIIMENGGEILNMATDGKGTSRQKVYYFRLASCDADPIVKALELAGHKILSVMN
ncbi:MAG: CBS domain-containing protein [Deltaproteobacteria bacterium]|nr:CBS domain-containing protein [Deltaproteobacteria bacterium]